MHDPVISRALTLCFNSDYVSGSVADSAGASEASKGTNPEAPSFTPSSPTIVDRGVRSPEDFMAHFRALKIANAEKNGKTLQPHRIVFKDVPDWANLTDIMCLVHGGDIASMTGNGGYEVYVDFVDPEACKRYYDTYSDGIRIGNEIMTLELGQPQKIDQLLKDMSDDGKSRVVYIDVLDGKKFSDLHQTCDKFDLDHLMYHVEPNKVRLLGYPFFPLLLSLFATG